MVSKSLIRAIAAQRSIKSDAEVAEMEKAHAITRDMLLYAMKHTAPSKYEREIAGVMEGTALAREAGLAYPVIFTVHGETLHNHDYSNLMQAGQMVVNDSGAAALSDYASDITRTIPVSGKFTPRQEDAYQIVYESIESGIAALRPGVKNLAIHRHCCQILAAGLKSLGLMKGNSADAVAAGAHALFFQCGVGHMIGLDVHDMENLGEAYMGYDEETQRSAQFGTAYLRLGKRLQAGNVITVEPGLYFIPALMDQWGARGMHREFINYDALGAYREFGGIRIEEDVLITASGSRILGEPIPKTVADVEAACGA